MYNYYQILRLARKRGIKLTGSTIRKDFCLKGIKPERFISRVAHFSERSVELYLSEKQSAKIGRPEKEFTVKGVTYKSEKDFIEQTGYTRSTAWYWRNKEKNHRH